MFGTAEQAAKSDGTKGVTTSVVHTGFYRFLVTFSSLVCLVAFPYYNLEQCLEVCLEILQYVVIIWAHKRIVKKNPRDSSKVTACICDSKKKERRETFRR